jgi:hypothetical protein
VLIFVTFLSTSSYSSFVVALASVPKQLYQVRMLELFLEVFAKVTQAISMRTVRKNIGNALNKAFLSIRKDCEFL